MKTLSEQVRINRRFQRSIRVDTDIDQPGALEGFVCPPSTAQALVSMAKQVSETGQGAFTWTGPYGSGKSSLAVALAALLGDDPGRRASAKAAIGTEAANEILSLLKSSKRNWMTLPVVGSRTDAATIISEALSGRRSSKKANGASVIEKLQAAADEAPGAGLLVIIDEMGKFLEQAAVEDSDVYFFQQLAEAA
jgi:energy-coupling factor transporter ATP-binding protein EcfA2